MGHRWRRMQKTSWPLTMTARYLLARQLQRVSS
jgi:hypothetical protein